MASHPLPIPVPTARQRAQTQASLPHVPVAAVIAVLSALLILFGWLHLILSLEIASMNREIQRQTRDLARLNRARSAVLQQIAAAESPHALESRVKPGEFVAQTPLYLSVEPIPWSDDLDIEPDAAIALSDDVDNQMSASQSRSLIESVLTRLDSWVYPAAGP